MHFFKAEESKELEIKASSKNSVTGTSEKTWEEKK